MVLSDAPSDAPSVCVPDYMYDDLGNPCFTVDLLSGQQTCTISDSVFTILAVNDTHVSCEIRQEVSQRGLPQANVNWMAVYFNQYGSPACYKEDFIAFGDLLNFGGISTFQADCVCGMAQIDIFAFSGAFNVKLDKAVIPAICNDQCACIGRRCGWRYRVPCGTGLGPRQCPAQRRSLVEETNSNSEVASIEIENREAKESERGASLECSSVWAHERSSAWCLSHFRKGKEGWTNKLTLTTDPIGMDILADQVDCRDIGFPVGQLWMSYVDGRIIANFTMEPGFEIKNTHLFVSGRRRLPKVRVDKTRQEVYDPEYFPLSHSSVDEASDIYYIETDEFKVYVAAHATVCGDFKAREAEVTMVQAAYEASLRCIDQVEVANENYEDGVVDGWRNGVIQSDQAIVGLFLGKLAPGQPPVFKDFTIPEGTKEIVIQFTLYEFGIWNPQDTLYFKILNAKLLVKLKRTPLPSGAATGSFLMSMDSYAVSVPHQYIQVGRKLPIGFEVMWSTSTRASQLTKKSAGIDNVLVTAHGEICHSILDVPEAASGFAHSKLIAPTTSFADTSTRLQEKLAIVDDGYFCLSRDFPCSPGQGETGDGSDGGDEVLMAGVSQDLTLVQVCLYSSAKGYATYCIPEQDSDTLRFHSNGYCGPCAGGYKIGDDPMEPEIL
jgi:hypothetical protein